MVPHDIGLLREQLKEIADQLKLSEKNNKSRSWFKKRDIEVYDKYSCWVLRAVPNSEINHWNILTNGAVFDKNGVVWSLPMFRIQSFGDVEGASFSGKDLVEKMDGIMVSVCFPTKNPSNPLLHTNSMISTCPTDIAYSSGEFLVELQKKLEKLKFIQGDLEKTFTFELVDGKKIIPYAPSACGLYLIGVRNLSNNFEYTEEEIDPIAERLGVKRPYRWRISSWKDISGIMDGRRDVLEGFILRSPTITERLKIQMEKFLKAKAELVAAKKKSNKYSYKRLLNNYLNGERIDSEKARKKFKIIDIRLIEKAEMVAKAIGHWRSTWESGYKNDRRGFISLVRSSPMSYGEDKHWMHKMIIKFINESEHALPMLLIEEMKSLNVGVLFKLLKLNKEQ